MSGRSVPTGRPELRGVPSTGTKNAQVGKQPGRIIPIRIEQAGVNYTRDRANYPKNTPTF